MERSLFGASIGVIAIGWLDAFTDSVEFVEYDCLEALIKVRLS